LGLFPIQGTGTLYWNAVSWLKKLPGHKAWWAPLADGRMVLHVLMGNVCLSVDVCMVDLGEIT
jgi:hypothetical protein